MRHDIDNYIKWANYIHDIEKIYSITSSFYFRLSTIDIPLMKKLIKSGSEASYHFEEIASYCKKHHIKDRDSAINEMEKIRKMFAKNFLSLEARLGTKLRSVASHGDFVNRKLRLYNWEITKDIHLRETLGIEVEAYDDLLKDTSDIYIADRPYPIFWHPVNPLDILDKYNVIYLLTHPRNWGRNIHGNLRENVTRCLEGLHW